MGIFSVFKETDAKGAQDLSRAKKIDERRHLCEKFLVFTTGTTHLSRALLCVLVGAQAWGAPADKSQLLKKFDYDNLHADTYMVNRPGKWESDLWYFREAGKPDQPFERPAPGRRPPPNGDCEFRLSKGGVVSLSSAVRIDRKSVV